MAFCNSCGTNIAPGTRFCAKCGAPILASSLPPVAPPAPVGSVPQATPVSAVAPVAASQPAGGSALKVILIVVGVIVIVGILAAASVGFFVWRVAHHTRIRHNGEDVRVETPFGTVQSTKDPQAAARDLGVDVYPGADVLKEGSASATFGGVHTAALNFETPDSVDKVCGFYKPKFPNAMVVTSNENQCTIVSNDQKNMITINARTEGAKTKIAISKVSKSDASNSSSN
ncbi:MAG: zinc ribbon domain-containing protein [Candidatus Sulfotelmatobacter sp.]